MAFRVRCTTLEKLNLDLETCEYLARLGATSLRVSVHARVPAALAQKMGYSADPTWGAKVPLARVLDPNGRRGNGEYDHIDRDDLNYRRDNLRLVTTAENAKNKGWDGAVLVFEP